MSSLCRFLIITVIACVVGLGIAELAQAQGYMMLDRSSGGYLHGGLVSATASGGDNSNFGFGVVFGGHAGRVADFQLQIAHAGSGRHSSATVISGGPVLYLVKQKLYRPGVSVTLGENISYTSFSGISSATQLTTTLGLHGCHSLSRGGHGGLVWSVGPSLIIVMSSGTETQLGLSLEIGGVIAGTKTLMPILLSASGAEDTYTAMLSVGLIFGGNPR